MIFTVQHENVLLLSKPKEKKYIIVNGLIIYKIKKLNEY